jgi:parallel beta-helix repeat protein
VCVVCLLCAFSGFAETYYISFSSGSDVDSGITPTAPYRTLGRAGGLVRDGDTVLLRRGDVFRESFSPSVPDSGALSVMAYGPSDLPRPVVSGSMPITGWTPYQGDIWVAAVDSAPRHLFVDNRMMLIARYPNRGFLHVLAYLNGRIRAPELEDHPRDADGYFDGMRVRLRAHSWWHELHTATNYQTSDHSFAIGGTLSESLAGWTFYLDDKLSELDTAGEWYHDAAAGKVYLWAPGSVDPNTVLVEGSVRSGGLSGSFTRVEEICFRHQTGTGLSAWGDDPLVERCTFEGIQTCALQLPWVCDGGLVRHCVFSDNISLAVRINQSNALRPAVVEIDTFYRTATIPAYEVISGNSNVQASAVVVHNGSGVRVSRCLIEQVGYAGIIFIEDGCTAEYNIIRKPMSTLNDGGGIYTNCNRNTFRHNIVYDSGVLDSGCHSSWSKLHHGIWPEFLGDWRENVIDSNTCVNSIGAGIFLPNNFECTIRGNVTFNNKTAGLRISGFERNTGVPQNHTITDNIFYAVARTQTALAFNTGFDFGTFLRNYYCNPSLPGEITGDAATYSLEQWQAAYAWADDSGHTDFAKRAQDSAVGNPRILINETDQAALMPLDPSIPWRDIDGNVVSGNVRVEPFYSFIVIPMDSGTSAVVRHATDGPVRGLRLLRRPGSVEFSYGLPGRSGVDLRVYNAAGREVCTLVSGVQDAGSQRAIWNARARGVYLASLRVSADGREYRRVVPLALWR